ncbi:PPC domain-containing DNA-binding protein [Planosporangium sp. 12N6]|uniref:PPC domain-containing DNA-binding protein n=1 Tax=Planosporangium spinosum TaxID=3402278 RepID=UPI003CEA3DFE
MIPVRPGQEVVETMSRDLRERGVANGAVISLIGTVDAACISTRPEGDASKDVRTAYEQPFELSGTGEITDGKVHLHVVLGAEDRALAGHLHWARVQTFFVNAYVEAL